MEGNALYFGLGSAIRTARKAKGVRLVELGEQVGLDNSSLSRIENDRQRVSSAQIAKIAIALGISLERLAPEVFGPKAASDQQPPTPRESSGDTTSKLPSETLRDDLRDLLPDKLRQHVGNKIVIQRMAYTYTYASDRVITMARQIPSPMAGGLSAVRVTHALLYKLLLALHKNGDAVGPARHHYQAIIIADKPPPKQLFKEAELFSITLHVVPDVAALAALIEQTETEPTEMDDVMEQHYENFGAFEFDDA